ncbi:MAG: Sec-independent protein translocase protein TatB [Nevskiales bacterium]
MFEISFGELVLVFLIALVVLGPERLPKAAQTLGRFTGQARVYLRNLMGQLQQEAQAVDLRRQLEQAQRSLNESLKLESNAPTPPAIKPPESA